MAQSHRSRYIRCPWIPGFLAFCATIVMGAQVARAVDYETYRILDDRRAYDVAMLDDDNIVVTSTVPALPYARVFTRMLWNHTLRDPIVLDEQAPLQAQPVLAACTRGFFVAYESGPVVKIRQGSGLSWGAAVSVGSGSLGKSGVRLAVDPHGAVYLLYSMGGDTWWAVNTPESNQWTTPQLAWVGQTSGQMAFKWLNGGWQPRIYGVTWTTGEDLSYRQYDGTSWQSPVVVIPSYGPQYGMFRVGNRADGRHFLACGVGFFAVTAFEEDASAIFQPAGTRVIDYGAGCTESMNFTPVTFDLVSGSDGTIHLFRYQENWRWQDGDLWLCDYGLFWEQSLPSGQWIDSPEGFFTSPDVFNGFPLFVRLPVSGGGPPVFCWYNGGTPLMVPINSAGIDDPWASAAAGLEISPNPSSGPVTIQWIELPPAVGRSLEVLSVEGRRVRALALNDRSEARWDGRDDAGRPVGSGTYFVRGTTMGGDPAVSRVVVLRRD